LRRHASPLFLQGIASSEGLLPTRWRFRRSFEQRSSANWCAGIGV